MGVYTTSNILTESTEVEIDLDTIQESAFEPGIQGAMMHVLECEENWKNIMEAVAFTELSYFAENGVEMVYEASSMTSFFSKVRQFFEKIIEKVASLFKKFIGLINSYVRSDADFIKKYRNQLLSASTKGFTYNGFKFTIDRVNVNSCASAVQNIINSKIKPFTPSLDVAYMKNTAVSVRENREDILQLMRGTCVTGQTSIEGREFQKELFKTLRNGEENAVEIKTVNVSDLLSTISGAKEARKEAEKAYKDVKNVIEEAIKVLKKMESDYAKQAKGKDDTQTALASASVSYISAYTSLLRDKANILQIVNGAILSALRQENRQAKAVCVKLLTYTPKDESYVGESTVSSFLDTVVLK